MKTKGLSILICFILVFAQLGALAAQEGEAVLFSDSFDSGIENWKMVKGTGYSAQGKKLGYRSAANELSPAIIEAGGFRVENCEVELDFSVSEGRTFGVVLRQKDENTHYLLRFYCGNGQVLLLKRVNGGSYSVVKSGKYKLAYSQQYRLHVTLLGEKITARINDTVFLEASDSSIESGTIGFEGNGGAFSVDNVKGYQKKGVDYTVEKQEDNKLVKHPAVIYVSPDGDDKNDGSQAKPYKTLEAAKLAARSLKKLSTPVNVILKEGEYVLDKTISFGKDDSGSPGAPITYMAEEGARVTFTGTKKLDVSKFQPVTDTKVLSRMYETVQGKVMQLDLKEQGISADLVNFTKLHDDPKTVGQNVKPISFYLNDSKQSLARWPNAGYTKLVNATGGTVIKTNNMENATNSATLFYSETNPSRWLEAENAYIEGFLTRHYHGEWAKIGSISPDQQSLKLQWWTWMAGITKGMRWAGINMLEEIDIPGEWYVNRDTMMLYYYPPHELTENDTFEIATLDNNLVSVDGAGNISFIGLEFAKNAARSTTTSAYPTSGGVGMLIQNSSNITVKDCIVRNIGLHGIHIRSSKNVLLEGNIIYDIGLSGVIVYDCGDRATLTSSGVVIKNNIIADVSVYSNANQQCGVLIYGDNVCGVTVENNLMYNAPNSAIRYKGNAHLIKNNEFYKTNLQTGDAGVIYTGRFWSEYGTVVQENYFHDIGCKDDKYHILSALYLDDAASGSSLINNIIYMNNKNITASINLGGGRDNTMIGNTVISSQYDVYINHRSTLNDLGEDSLTYYNIFQVPFNDPIYVEKYPGIQENYNNIMAGRGFIQKNTVTDNLYVDCNETRIDNSLLENGTIENNVTVNDMSIFVDPENQDFRVKSDAKQEFEIPDEVLDETYDIEKIGLANGYKIEDRFMRFSKLYPLNGQGGVQSASTTLAWSKAVLADEYEYKVATDAQMTDIVASGRTNYNSAEITGLSSNMVYYWTVSAISTSRQQKRTVEASEGISAFTTAEHDFVDKAQLGRAIENAESMLPNIVESDKAGDYKVGTAALMREVIEAAKASFNNEFATIAQVNMAAFELASLLNTLDAHINVGYTSLSFSKTSEWSTTKPLTTQDISDNSATLVPGDARANVTLNQKIPVTQILCFKARLGANTLEGGFIGYAINQQNVSVNMYSDNCYYVCIKADKLEFQNSGTIIATVPNEGIFKNETEHEVQMGAITTTNGVNFIFIVDGVKVFDYLDQGNPKAPVGMFSVSIPPNRQMTVSGTQSLPAGNYALSDLIKEKLENADIQVINTTSGTYKETGTWSDSSAKGYEGSKVRTSVQAGASVEWMATGQKNKLYKISFWNIPAAGSDKQAKLHVYTSSKEYTADIDLSAGEAGFIELGVFEFMDENTRGTLNIKLTGSGAGQLMANALRVELIDGQEGFADMLK